MKTYYIVEHVDVEGKKYWWAHRRGIFSMLNIFGAFNMVRETCTYHSPDACEKKLRGALHPVKPKVVRVVRI